MMTCHVMNNTFWAKSTCNVKRRILKGFSGDCQSRQLILGEQKHSFHRVPKGDSHVKRDLSSIILLHERSRDLAIGLKKPSNDFQQDVVLNGQVHRPPVVGVE